MSNKYFWYIPNQVEPGHRGDKFIPEHNSLASLSTQAHALEKHGFSGALIGTGWGRPDTFTVATALSATTNSFEPIIAARPGYWQPAHFASSIATLDQLSNGRVNINIVSGKDHLEAYGDTEAPQAERYARTQEFMQLVRQLWTKENVTFTGRFYHVNQSTVQPRIAATAQRPHPTIYFGGASAAAELVAAAEADVQLFWGEPLNAVAERIDRLRRLSNEVDRQHKPLEFGLRITTVVRETSAVAWRVAEAKVDAVAQTQTPGYQNKRAHAVGQQRLYDLAAQGDVLDDNLFVRPAKFGAGGAAGSWLVGSAQEVASALEKYAALGINRFILSDTPYLDEIHRQGELLLPELHR